MIHIQTTTNKDRIVKRCHKYHKNIKFGEHYTLQQFSPIAWQDLKMSYKLVPIHFPYCEQSKTGFGADRMGRSYTIIDGIDTPHKQYKGV